MLENTMKNDYKIKIPVTYPLNVAVVLKKEAAKNGETTLFKT